MRLQKSNAATAAIQDAQMHEWISTSTARFMLSEPSQAPELALFATSDNSANSRYAASLYADAIYREKIKLAIAS